MNDTTPNASDFISPVFLSDIESLFGELVNHVRTQVAARNEPINQALDAFQVQGFELANIRAELHAARAIITYASRCGEQAVLERDLCGVFVADIVVKLRARFERLRYGASLSAARLAAVFEAPEVDGLLSHYLASETLDHVGEQVAAADDNGRSLLDEDKQIIASSFRRVADEVVSPHAASIHRDDLIVPDDIIATLADMGCFALSIPERFGGSAPEQGHDNLAMCVATEELSRGSLAAAGSPLTRPEIAARAIMAGGHEPQQQKWLPGIAVGDPLVAISVTEPDTGSDVAAIRLKATRCEGGFKLSGAKTWCTFAGKSGLLFVLARTDPDLSRAHRGLSLFLVEKEPSDDKAFEITQPDGGKLSGQAIPTIGYRGMHSFTLFFDDFFVPADNLVGGPDGEGKGFYLTMQGFAGGRLQTAARACGVMRAAFEAAVRYARERKVFGQALGAYQLTRAKLAIMAANLRACQEMTYHVAALMDEGDGQMEASLVKLYACRAAEYITREALQIHGGMGYSEETPVSRYFVDARVLSIFEGAEETLALKVVARDLLGAKR